MYSYLMKKYFLNLIAIFVYSFLSTLVMPWLFKFVLFFHEISNMSVVGYSNALILMALGSIVLLCPYLLITSFLSTLFVPRLNISIKKANMLFGIVYGVLVTFLLISGQFNLNI